MSIATEIQELTQNTAELDGIRTSMREKLVAKGIDASTHNFADFPNDVESISSGGGIYEIKSETYAVKLANGYYYCPDKDGYSYGKLMTDPSTPLSINFSSATTWRVIVKFMFTGTKTSGTRNFVNGGTTSYGNGIEIEYDSNGILAGGYSSTSSPSSTNVWAFKQIAVELNTWYYVCLRYDNGNLSTALYDADGELVDYVTITASNIYNRTFTPQIGGLSNWEYATMQNGTLDMNEMLYEADSVAVWGKTNSKTQNMGFETT